MIRLSKEGVSKEDLDALAKVVGDRICELEGKIEKLSSESREPKEVRMEFHKCTEEGCAFQTDDPAVFIEHLVDERLKKLGLASSMEETDSGEEEKPMPKRRHTRAEEFMDCPECAPRFEKMLEEMGWEKPKPKPKSSLL